MKPETNANRFDRLVGRRFQITLKVASRFQFAEGLRTDLLTLATATLGLPAECIRNPAQ